MTETTSISQIAREVLEGALSEWKEDIDYYKNVVDGSINFIFLINTAYGPSIVYYNPQSDAEKIVEACRYRLEGTALWKAERYRERFLKSDAGQAIRLLLTLAPLQFKDALSELSLVAITRYESRLSQPNVKRRLFRKTLQDITDRLKRRLGMKERGRPSIIADQTVYSAINILGGAPSQRKTSQFIGVSEKTLREWRKSKGFKQWGDFISSATGRKSN